MTGPIVFDARTVQDHFPGIARYAYNLARALADTAPEREFRLLAPPASGNSRFDLSPFESRRNVRLACIPAPVFSPDAQWRVPLWLRGERALLYHSPYYLMPYWTPCPAIVTVHDLIPMVYPRYYTAMQRLAFGVTMRLAVRTARVVLADSEAAARDIRLRLKVPAERVFVVYAAPDPALAPATPEERARIREKYQLPESFILYVGSNKPHKNLVRLVQSFAAVRQRQSVPLVIAGHWDADHPEARAEAEERGIAERIFWAGPVPQGDLAGLYSAATLFVFPSEYEGFGLPVLEAMACGAPVICSNSSSLPEVVGSAAVMLDARHVDGWTHAIERLLPDSARRSVLRAAGLRRASLFTWEAAARKVLDIYSRIEAEVSRP